MADAQVRQVVGIKQFFRLSRMTHSVLDVAHPAVGGALAAVLLGGPPSPRTIILGLIAGFAGYSSVFALNDIIDVKVDREKMEKYRSDRATFDLDSMGQRHPLAQPQLRGGGRLGGVLGPPFPRPCVLSAAKLRVPVGGGVHPRNGLLQAPSREPLERAALGTDGRRGRPGGRLGGKRRPERRRGTPSTPTALCGSNIGAIRELTRRNKS